MKMKSFGPIIYTGEFYERPTRLFEFSNDYGFYLRLYRLVIRTDGDLLALEIDLQR